MRRSTFFVGALLLAGCAKKDEVPVCGLHSAAKPVVITLGKKEQNVSVGSKFLPSDHLRATGDALLECFGGALKRIEKGDEFDVGDLIEAKIESTNIERKRLVDGKLVEVAGMRRTVAPRYLSNSYTPASALAADETATTGQYFVAFFTPNGFDKMKGPVVEGPRKLPPPSFRARVPSVHAGPLGEGPWLITVDDEVVFAETDDLATAALLEDQTYQLGRTVRLILPKGAKASLELNDGQKVKLKGPMDLALR